MNETTSPFDTTRSSLPTRLVPVDQIVDILHVTHAPDQIEEYRNAMLSGTCFPPISVVRTGRRYVIADGHKRFAASVGLGITTLDVEVWTTRRLVTDQLEQARRHARFWWRAISGLHRGRTSRREALVLMRRALRHWWRVAVSLWGFVVKPRRHVLGSIHGKRSSRQIRRPG